MADTVFYFDEGDLEKQLSSLKTKGITQVHMRDISICTNKKKLHWFLNEVHKQVPDVFFDFYVPVIAGSHSVLDDKIITAFSLLFCSIHIPLPLPAYQKPFAKKITHLNNAGLIFGFELNASNYVFKKSKKVLDEFDQTPFSSIKMFCNSLDFAMSLYPNDIVIDSKDLKPTAQLSTQDIKKIQRFSFAIYTFYSAGRAVPWFNAVVQALSIKPSVFFADFSEWLYCNNAADNSFNPAIAGHEELEKMQLVFLQLKFEEKRLNHVFPVLKDLVRIHAAFSRVAAAESEKEAVELFYNPDDVLSGYAMNLVSFAEQVCMEKTFIHVFAGQNGPEYKISNN
ncbi:MAG TPA: hypothetical protein VFC68_00250 [Treponemataceae bacterium]|nr:hypothetical protein [Treponemataceae bacterium]